MNPTMAAGAVRRQGDAPAWVTVHDPAFLAVLGDDARVVCVAKTDAHEGPVYVAADDALYFTAPSGDVSVSHRGNYVPGTQSHDVRLSQSRRASILRLALDGDPTDLDPGRLSVLGSDVRSPNGMVLDPDGALIVCDQGTLSDHPRIARVDRRTGQTETIVDQWGGLRLNSPNDVVVRRDGSIWFTDPSYGHLQGFRPEPEVGDYVYRYEPATGRLTVVADSFDKPNGLAFSPDERVLYITDSGANQREGSYHVGRPHHIKAFHVAGDRHLAGERLFAVTTPGFPDGLKVDSDGRVYASSPAGVQVLEPSGDLIGQINLPGTVNFTFGGVDGNVLYVTTDDAVWAVSLNARGMP
jgi:gluconolactonase